jgi:hypothetical protein
MDAVLKSVYKLVCIIEIECYLSKLTFERSMLKND